MKKHLCFVMALAMLFTCVLGTTAFAAEPEDVVETNAVQTTSADEITPRAGFNGYGNHWYNAGEPISGSFPVSATGSSNPGYMTLNIDSFAADVGVRVKVLRPNGVEVYDSFSWRGDYITMANRDTWYGIRIPNATAGTYTIQYTIYGFDNPGHPSSGRINVWFYN